MRDVLQKMRDLFQAIAHLPEGERAFLAAYLQNTCYFCPPADFDFERASTINLVAIYDQYGSTSSLTLIRDLLLWCYDNDKDDNYYETGEVCNFLSELRFDDRTIEAVLLKGIWDRQKTNRLRERFFWRLRGHFKAAAVQFFKQDFSRFLAENAGNNELIIPLINYLPDVMDKHPGLPAVEEVAFRYLAEHPENAYNLYPEILLKRLGIGTPR